MLRERAHRRELHALRVICDDLLVGPDGRRHAAAQIGERLIRSGEAEGTDSGLGHGDLLLTLFAPCWNCCVPVRVCADAARRPSDTSWVCLVCTFSRTGHPQI